MADQKVLGKQSLEPVRKQPQPALVQPESTGMSRPSVMEMLQRVATDLRQARPAHILALQRATGNRAVSHLIQAKLTVGAAGDQYEREADRIAERVMSMPMPVSNGQQVGNVQRQEEEEEVQTKPLAATITPLVQRQAAPEEEEVQTMPLQRQEVPEEEEIQTMSLRREAVPEEEEVQTMPLQRQAVPEEEEEMIQMTSLLQRRSDGSFEAGGEFERRLSGTRGEGQPLPPFTRTEFDAKFGVDFSGVRVHTGSESATLNRAIQAKAFTLGSDIHFGAGHYAPETAGGKQLLAHELAHVVQQGGAAIRRQPKPGLRKVDAGTLAGHESTEEEEVVKGPDDRVKLDGTGNSTRTASAPSAASPSAGNLPIAMGNIGFRFSNVGVTTSGSTTNRKDVRVAWKNPGGMAVDPFGEEAYRPSWKNANYTVNEGRLKLDFTLDINCPWGVNNGGKTDVPSATDAIVTAASYKQIVSDLTPVKIEKCWRAPRRQYWSQKVCERHEKYHSTDDKQWTEGPGRTLVINYLKGKTVSSNSIQADLTAHLDNAITQLSRANTAYYTGGATSYLSYAGEERAFGDGKEPYEQLAQGVKSQGEKLEAKAKKKWWQFWK